MTLGQKSFHSFLYPVSTSFKEVMLGDGFISYWFFALPIGIYLAFNEIAGIPNEAEGIWVGMIIGITISAILNTGRLKYKKGLLKKLS